MSCAVARGLGGIWSGDTREEVGAAESNGIPGRRKGFRRSLTAVGSLAGDGPEFRPAQAEVINFPVAQIVQLAQRHTIRPVPRE